MVVAVFSFAYDEINLIVPGANYGWPAIQGNEKKGNMETPLFHSGSTTWAPSGMAFHKGTLFVAQLRGQGIRAFDLENKTHKQVVSGFGRVRDVFIIGSKYRASYFR
nr:PQQ-dependent sugar dehydrogenase [Pallidibacillus pasinlerensis]